MHTLSTKRQRARRLPVTPVLVVAMIATIARQVTVADSATGVPPRPQPWPGRPALDATHGQETEASDSTGSREIPPVLTS